MSPRSSQLEDTVQTAAGLMDQCHFADAVPLLLEAVAMAERAGFRSAHLFWMVGIAYVYTGTLRQSLEAFEAALDTDPFHAQARSGRDAALSIAHDLLVGGRDKAPAELYELLRDRGAACHQCHLAMAKHLVAAGQHQQALDVLQQIEDHQRDRQVQRAVWQLRGDCARGLDDAKGVNEAALEVMVRTTGGRCA